MNRNEENSVSQPTPNLGMEASAEAEQQSNVVLGYVLKLRSELRMHARQEDGTPYVLIEDTIRKKFFRVGDQEYQIVSKLDGQRDGHRIANEIASQVGSKQTTERVSFQGMVEPTVCTKELAAVQDRTEAVFRWLLSANLVACQQLDNGKRLSQQADMMAEAKWLGAINPISIKVPLGNPDQLLQKLTPWFGWVFSQWFLMVWFVTGVFAAYELFGSWDRLGSSTNFIFTSYGWVWLLVSWVLLKLVHELAHGIACRRCGGDVPEAGVLFLLLTPMAYVNVTSMWQFRNRWHRMLVSSAGMYVELFIAFVAAIVWSRTTGVVSQVAMDVLLMASVTTILFNANPLMRFDGYFILSDLLGIPNLYTKGVKWFGANLKQLCFGITASSPTLLPREKSAVRIYGVLAFVWKIMIGFSLVLGAAVLFQGAGIILSALAILLWYGIPFFKELKSWTSPESSNRLNVRRSLTSLATVGLMVLLLFWAVQAPATKSAPAVVQFVGEQVIRAGADGFIDKLKIGDGQPVKAGQLIMQLSNPKLVNEAFHLERQVAESEIQIRIFRDQQDHASVQAEQANRDQLKEQLLEKRTQLKELDVRAPMDGFVFFHGLEDRLGEFVSQGDILLYSAKRAEKEILVSVDQRDFDAVSWKRGNELRTLFPGRSVGAGKLISVDPAASVRPSHPSLCANAGGILPVRAGGAESEPGSVELLHPRFEVRLALPDQESQSLFAGQRGRVFYTSAKQSLGSYCLLAVRDWLTARLEPIATN